MGRTPRIVIPGLPYHVTQRGNQRQTVFHADLDRQVYLDALNEYGTRYGLEYLGYCLMSNHIHLVVVPRNEGSLPKTMRETHRDFARWQHVRQRLTGHLWQNRYFSCPLDEAHCWETLRYVEMNPVRAGIVDEAWQWPWSSARAHLGIGPAG